MCALMDTGAQVNVMGDSLCRELLSKGDVTFCEIDRKVVGIGQCRTPVSGLLTA